MLWRTSHHALRWIQCQISILVMLFVRWVWVVWAWIDIVSCGEGLEFCSFRIFVSNNCYLVEPFQQCKGLSIEFLWMEFYFPGDLFSAVEHTHIVFLWVSRHWLFFNITGFVFDINLHGVFSDYVKNHFRLFVNIFCNFLIWRRYCLWKDAHF